MGRPGGRAYDKAALAWLTHFESAPMELTSQERALRDLVWARRQLREPWISEQSREPIHDARAALRGVDPLERRAMVPQDARGAPYYMAVREASDLQRGVDAQQPAVMTHAVRSPEAMLGIARDKALETQARLRARGALQSQFEPGFAEAQKPSGKWRQDNIFWAVNPERAAINDVDSMPYQVKARSALLSPRGHFGPVDWDLEDFRSDDYPTKGPIPLKAIAPVVVTDVPTGEGANTRRELDLKHQVQDEAKKALPGRVVEYKDWKKLQPIAETDHAGRLRAAMKQAGLLAVVPQAAAAVQELARSAGGDAEEERAGGGFARGVGRMLGEPYETNLERSRRIQALLALQSEMEGMK